ncbi:hypothetical protein [Nocardia heshunensis]
MLLATIQPERVMDSAKHVDSAERAYLDAELKVREIAIQLERMRVDDARQQEDPTM